MDLVKALENAKQTVPPELTALAEGFDAKVMPFDERIDLWMCGVLMGWMCQVTRGEARYHGSGFKGKGFTFDESERNESQRVMDLQKRQYEIDQGILVEVRFPMAWRFGHKHSFGLFWNV